MQIKNYKAVENKVCKARFTLVLNLEDLEVLLGENENIEIDCAYFQKQDGVRWLNTCAKEYQTPDGKKKYWNMFRPSVEAKNKLLHQVDVLMESQSTKSSNQEELPF